MAGAIKGNIA